MYKSNSFETWASSWPHFIMWSDKRKQRQSTKTSRYSKFQTKIMIDFEYRLSLSSYHQISVYKFNQIAINFINIFSKQYLWKISMRTGNWWILCNIKSALLEKLRMRFKWFNHENSKYMPHLFGLHLYHSWNFSYENQFDDSFKLSIDINKKWSNLTFYCSCLFFFIVWTR
jgi:hypothetical protein